MIDDEVAAHYLLGLEEGRLFLGDRPRLEYCRTLELLDRLLPVPPGSVLDVGGATGVYALPLAERGYSVTIVDPIAVQVERANQLADAAGWSHRVQAHVGDARDLAPFGGDHDAVLMLGPLYHLPDGSDRAAAWSQAVRATRPGGSVVAVGISRYASLLDGLKRRILSDPVFRQIVEQDLINGRHRNPDVLGKPEYFTTAYFHQPDELLDEARTAGLVDVQMLAVEGPAWMVEDIDDIENQLFAARAVESDPAVMGVSSHLLVSGRVPG